MAAYEPLTVREQNVLWYTYLVQQPQKGLKYFFADFNQSEIRDGLVVCREFVAANGQFNKRRYAFFRSYMDYYAYLCANSSRNEFFCHHEVLAKGVPRKMFFDIDAGIEVNNSEGVVQMDHFVYEGLKEAIANVYREQWQVELQILHDIIVFTSHTPIKRSYHVIIDNYYLMDEVQTEYLARKVVAALSAQWEPFISTLDLGVYTGNHNLRMPLQSKLGKQAVKTIVTELPTYIQSTGPKVAFNWLTTPHHQSQRFIELETLRRGLITNLGSCRPLRALVNAKDIAATKKAKQYTMPDGDNVLIDQQVYQLAIQFFFKEYTNFLNKLVCGFSGDQVYIVRDILFATRLILLTRQSSGPCMCCVYCPSCSPTEQNTQAQRLPQHPDACEKCQGPQYHAWHDADHAFIRLSASKFSHGAVFACRRSTKYTLLSSSSMTSYPLGPLHAPNTLESLFSRQERGSNTHTIVRKPPRPQETAPPGQFLIDQQPIRNHILNDSPDSTSGNGPNYLPTNPSIPKVLVQKASKVVVNTSPSPKRVRHLKKMQSLIGQTTIIWPKTTSDHRIEE